MIDEPWSVCWARCSGSTCSAGASCCSWSRPRTSAWAARRSSGSASDLTAFLLGARHAFDADHIAIIDNTTRKLVGEGTRSLGTGFWFALGHSSVVFGLALLLAVGVRAVADPVQDGGSSLQHSLGIVGSLAAGTFLILIGLMNISALVGIVHVYRHLRAGTFDEDQLHHHLHNRGFFARLFKSAIARVRKPWHLYPVGLLMGLGFDTATQVALLVLAGGTAAYALPWYAVLVLPVLFTAGMTLFDTIDGLFMTRAYRWAVLDPARKLFYNFSVTALSVAIAHVDRRDRAAAADRRGVRPGRAALGGRPRPQLRRVPAGRGVRRGVGRQRRRVPGARQGERLSRLAGARASTTEFLRGPR